MHFIIDGINIRGTMTDPCGNQSKLFMNMDLLECIEWSMANGKPTKIGMKPWNDKK